MSSNKENIIKEIFRLQNKEEELKKYLSNLKIEDIADIIDFLPEELQLKVAKNLGSAEDIADLLKEVDEEVEVDLVKSLENNLLREVLDNLSIDEIVDLIEELPENEQKRIKSLLNKEQAGEVELFLSYEEDTVGSIATPEIMTALDTLTVAEALSIVKTLAPMVKIDNYLFVVDKNDKFVGVLRIVDLITADISQTLREVLENVEDVVAVNVNEDKEKVAQIAVKYHQPVIPVIDESGRLIGAVAAEEVLETVEEEAEEDVMKMIGAADPEEKDPIQAIKERLPWLIVNLIGGMLAGSVMKIYQGTLAQNLVLAFFVPVITGMGGNAALQTATTVVRGLATGEIMEGYILKYVAKEIFISFLVGIACGLIAMSVASLMAGKFLVGVVVGLAMLLSITIASSVGAILPVVFSKVGVDPAVSTGPFVTTSNDILGIFIYFTLAKLILF